MKRILFLLLIVFSVADSDAQYYKYWVTFTDKNGSPYSVSNPSVYLSARAIYRRTKYGIPVKTNDFPPNPNYVDSVVAKGVTPINRSRWLNAISVYAPDTNDLAAIRKLPFVKSVQLAYADPALYLKKRPKKDNFRFPTGASKRPESGPDTLNFGYAYQQLHQIQVDCLNNMGYRGKGKQIAILDTRFGVAHTLTAFDSVYSRGGVLATWDFVWKIKDVYDDTNNTDTHGQMVFSCIAGIIPGQMMGDAPDADFYLLRTEDNYSENIIEDENWASGAEYADSAGADVISSSLGYDQFDDAAENLTYADMNGKVAAGSRAATIATEKGMVVCVAAGNEGSNSWYYITSPGDADSILTVGAVMSNGQHAGFSSFGPTSDGRIKPDVSAMGYYDYVASPYGGVLQESGTSFATPIIAGAAASLWQSDTNASNFQIMASIKQSATIFSHPNDSIGYGIPNFCMAQNILLGITENKPVNILNKVYPDPFTGDINILFFSSVNQNVVISIYNMLGQAVYQKEQHVGGGGSTLVTINSLQQLPGGLYLAAVTDEQGITYTQKVVKK